MEDLTAAKKCRSCSVIVRVRVVLKRSVVFMYGQDRMTVNWKILGKETVMLRRRESETLDYQREVDKGKLTAVAN